VESGNSKLREGPLVAASIAHSMASMKQERRFHIQVVLDGGATMETTFIQTLEKNESPAIRFYMGYSSDDAKKRDLEWLTVGDIGYDPKKVMAVRIAALDQPAAEEDPPAEPAKVRRLTSLPAAAEAPTQRRRRG